MSRYETVRWGILGIGNIAHAFAEGLRHTPGARLVAAGSRDVERARAFALQHGAPHAYGSYEELASDPEVDAIYIATHHPQHAENALLCLSQGKHVLVEKPFAMNASQTDWVARSARNHGLLCMEAMWNRFTPLMPRLKQLLQEEAIGKPRLLSADFGFVCEFNPQHRIFDPLLGGGALLDVGCYPLALSSLVFPTAIEVSGVATLGETGVDEQCVITLKHKCGGLSMLMAACRVRTSQEAIIYGTEGTLRIPSPWWLCPRQAILSRPGRPDETIEVELSGNGYQYEAIEFGNCLREGRLESSIMPMSETVENLRVMDKLRKQWKLSYPEENPWLVAQKTPLPQEATNLTSS